MLRPCIFLILSFYLLPRAVAQDPRPLNDYGRFTFLYANDVANGTDRYLTQYARLSYATPCRNWKNKRVLQHEFSIQQDVYTPSDIFGDTIQRNDRPYSSILFAAMQRHVLDPDKKLMIRSRLALGIIGRHGFGQDMQSGIHYAIDSRQALGWKYQVRDAAFIQLQGAAEKSLLAYDALDYVPYLQVNAGTVFNDLSIGHSIRVHLRDPYFAALNTSALKSFRLYAEMKNELKLVAYNGTLQGAIGSRNNPYVLNQADISPLVTLTRLSMGIACQRFGMNISQTFLSREFRTGLSHRWSHIALSCVI